jgi:hypothetical protein
MNKQNLIVGLLVVAIVLLGLNLFLGGKESGYPAPAANPGAAQTPAQPVTGTPSISPTNTEQLPPDATPVDPAKMTTISFAETTHDFGTKKKPGKARHVFKFKNTGDKPLNIANVQAGCGCTTPGWTKEPVAPGASGEVTAEVDLDKAGSGRVDKSLTVTGNFAESVKLHMVGEVIE